jgi:hypothetical protein
MTLHRLELPQVPERHDRGRLATQVDHLVGPRRRPERDSNARPTASLVRTPMERAKPWQAVGTDAAEETNWRQRPPSLGSGWGLPLMTGHVGLTEGMN